MTSRTFSSGRVLLGVVTSPHGLRGQFKVKSFTDPPANLIDYGDVMLPTGQSLKLELVGMHKDLLIILCKIRLSWRLIALNFFEISFHSEFFILSISSKISLI